MRRISALLAGLAFFGPASSAWCQYYPNPQGYNYGYPQYPANYPRNYYAPPANYNAYNPYNGYNSYNANNGYNAYPYRPAPQYPAYYSPPMRPYTANYGFPPQATQPMPQQYAPQQYMPQQPMMAPQVTASPAGNPDKASPLDIGPKLDFSNDSSPATVLPQPMPSADRSSADRSSADKASRSKKAATGHPLDFFHEPVVANGEGACSDGSCGGCCASPCKSPCEKCEPKKPCGCGHFYFDPGFNYLQPRWMSDPNPAFISRLANPGAAVSRNQQDFRYRWQFTPELAFGYVAERGFGVRARWWFFDQTANESVGPTSANLTAATASPLGVFNTLALGENALASSRLLMHVADIEATQDIWIGSSLLKFAAGARYAYLFQRYEEQQFNPAGAFTSGLISTQRFNGGGPTVAAEGLRQLGNTGLGFYGKGRGSLLFGSYPQNVSSIGGVAITQASRTPEDTMPVLEMEAGVQYSRSFGRTVLFFRTGAVGTVWFGAGNSSNSNPSFNGLAVDPNGLTRQNLTFLGVNVTAGIYY